MKWSDGPLLGLDLETTGKDPLTAIPVSFALCNFEGEPRRVRYGLVDPGVPIPPEATAIHGITDADAKERGGELEKSLIGIAGELLAASFAGTPVVGMNTVYDLTVVDACLRRLPDGEGLEAMGWKGPVIDVLVIDRHVDQFRRGSRKLSALCDTYGVALGDAHHAAADTLMAIEVARAIAAKYPEVGDADLDTLFHLQKAWRVQWVDSYSAHLVRKGEQPLDPSEKDWPIRRIP